MSTDGLSLALSLQHKINLGNYESAECFVSVSGVSVNTTPDDIDEILDQSKIVYTKIAESLRAKIKQARAGMS